MAAYFIKYTYSRGGYGGRGHDNVIIDFERFEKVNSESIYKKIEAKSGRRYVNIEDIVKL